MFRFFSMLLCLLTCFSGVAFAWPDRPITLIVPFGAGGGTDVPARLYASMLEKKLGQPLVIQNIVGAGGTQGIGQLAAAKADGYTIGYAPTGTLVLQPHLLKLPYGRDSFDFVGNVIMQPAVAMTPGNAPWKTFDEMVSMVRANPNKYVCAITSVGNMTHLPMLELMKQFDLKLKIIPYRTTAEIMKDMAAGRVHFHADGPVALSQFDVWGLVAFTDERLPNLPHVPSGKELGFKQHFSHWQGVVAPKGLPPEVLEKLSRASEEVVTSPEFIEATTKMSTNAHWMNGSDFVKMFKQEYDSYGAMIRELFPRT